MYFRFLFCLLLVPLIGLSQEVLILDEEKNPIPNVAAFNNDKAKSALSNHDGIVNLSRFLSNETISFQHPSYKLIELSKSGIKGVVTLEVNYTLLEAVKVGVDKNENNIKNVAEKKIFIASSEIVELGSITTPDLLEKKGGITVQKSQMGGGSPNIRGFEANRILLVLDGVRLNNAIYRSAHLQNLVTIDEYLLDDIEIVFGPSSVLYGSDALGGTINMKSKDVFFKSTPSFGGGMFSSYSSAYSGLKANFFTTFESSKFSIISSVSFKKFGDLAMGSWRPHGYEDWGLVHHYIGADGNVVCNPNPETQKNTGYRQYDFFNKMIFKISENWRAKSNIQYSTSSNVPRFDRLNDGDSACLMDSNMNCSTGDLRFHSYYYGPQERLFNSLNITGIETKLFDRCELIVAHQFVKESRHNLKLSTFLNEGATNDNLMSSTYEEVRVYSVNTNFKKGNIYFGSETIYNDVRSSSNLLDPNEKWSIGDTRYPPDGSSLFTSAIYLNSFWRISHKIQLELGGRYTFSDIQGAYPDTLKRPFALVEGLRLSEKSNILSGNIKLVYYPSDSWKISSVTAKGFHTPNVDDMLKVFDKMSRLVVPNIFLKPEHSLSQEISISKNINSNIDLYGVGFYTRIKNAMVLDSIGFSHGINPFTGDPLVFYSWNYDGEIYDLFANQNAEKPADIFGLTMGFSAVFNGFELNGDFNITRGINHDPELGPVAHIPPVFGKIELIKKLENWKLKLLYLYAGEKAPSEFDEANVDNLYETPFLEDLQTFAGSPRWSTFNFSVIHEANDLLKFQLSVDNIFDRHYKTFSSGISAGGRNFIFSTTILL